MATIRSRLSSPPSSSLTPSSSSSVSSPAGAGGGPEGLPRSPELAAARRDLLEGLRGRGVPERIVAAFAAVPRERFVAPAYRAEAYADRALPFDEEQTISQPYMIARMLMEVDLRPEDRVLDIGTGTGYQAALLSQLCREVHSVEVRPRLLAQARETLAGLGYANLRTYLGDGRLGLPQAAPFDAILCAAATSEVPRPLLDQLAPGGRLALPVGTADLQWLQVARKRIPPRGGEARIEWCTLDACTFVPLVSSS